MTIILDTKDDFEEFQREARRLGRSYTVVQRMGQRCITKHPNFHTKKWDWGVIPARWSEPWYDEETGEFHASVYVPEDRSGWIPEWDGKSMADFWDAEKGCFISDGPKCFQGITNYLAPEIVVTWKERA